jgi:hypothetical protein
MYIFFIIYNCLYLNSYQKTESVVKTTAEKATTIFGGFGSGLTTKLGQIKNSESFRSFEEKVGSALENVKVHTIFLVMIIYIKLLYILIFRQKWHLDPTQCKTLMRYWRKKLVWLMKKNVHEKNVRQQQNKYLLL